MSAACGSLLNAHQLRARYKPVVPSQTPSNSFSSSLRRNQSMPFLARAGSAAWPVTNQASFTQWQVRLSSHLACVCHLPVTGCSCKWPTC